MHENWLYDNYILLKPCFITVGNVSSFKVAMGITIPMAILIAVTVAIFSVVFASICVSQQRKQIRPHGKD